MGWQRGITAVLDTNVLLGVHRHAMLRFAVGGDYKIVWSDYIAQELQRKFSEMGWRLEKASALFNFIDQMAIKVDHTLIEWGNYDEWLLDVDDHPIMATAIMGRVDYLVSNNTKDFPPKKRFAEITIITPDAFMRLLES